MQQNTPLKMPTVMTRKMVTKAVMFISDSRSPLSPTLCAAISATFSSYCSAERRSQESGTPRVPLRAMTPSRILMEGSRVKVALEMMAFFSTFLSIPMAIPAR